ncbi:DNA cytosine methyltransferase [Nocardiopsis sp. FR6]|uniref:DNA cytosine methyltransferase n=1 Tax=Nocardiopsis sp. FR6 TaxID=2605986 RepID=UPI00351A9697
MYRLPTPDGGGLWKETMSTTEQPWRVGSLCTGYGGLELGLAQALGTVETAWCADPDPHVSTILEQRFPGTPNRGDITRLDPKSLDPVDIITAGFPCQDVSSAGRGAGVEQGARSGIWTHVVEAVRQLEPRYVYLENVEALRWRGRGLHRVLSDLAQIGYDARWTCLRASDVGAPHRRERIFILAEPAAHTPGPRQRPRRQRPCPTTRRRTPGQPHRPHHRMAHSSNVHQRYQRLHSTQSRNTAGATRGIPVAHAHGHHLRQQPLTQPRCHPAPQPKHVGVHWGVYAQAIHHWERVLGRPSPLPHERGQRGRPRLNPRWVEWLMGLPEGWVTDCDIARPQQLRALGNGVVPDQATEAFKRLYHHSNQGQG